MAEKVIVGKVWYSKDIERFGTGLKRIAEACDVAGVRYEFKKMKSGFVVCFYRSEEKADKKPIKAIKTRNSEVVPISIITPQILSYTVKKYPEGFSFERLY